jgi:two-component system, OmpR family, sensor histidine kinase KdpD
MNQSWLSALRSLAGLLGVGAVTLVFSQWIPVNAASAGFLYLILILAVATLWGLSEAAIASVAAVLCYNFYFLPPVGMFTIADPQNWVALFTFLITALVASHFSDRAKKQTMEAKRRQRETERLYALSRAILLTDAAKPVGAQAVQQISQIFEVEAVAIYDSKSGTLLHGGAGEISGVEGLLKQVVLQGAPHLDAEREIEVWPIALGGQPIGSLAAKRIHLSDSAVQALLNLVAIALERVRTEEAANQAEIARKNEEFKSTLLDAIAHEFKTPLTSIKAAASSLLSEEGVFDASQSELITIIDEETDRLSLLVTEAVKMSQIEAGKLKIERQATRVEVIWKAALASLGGRTEDRIELGETVGLPEVMVDAELMSLALKQLIDNALKYAPPQTLIRIGGEVMEEMLCVRVSDEGPGIPERDREKIFEKYYRRAAVREKVPGSGLGLHIARQIVQAQGGDLWLEGHGGQGSQFCLTLPLAAGVSK